MSDQWKKKRLKRGNLPPEVAKTEAAFGRCPNGHKLPHRTNRGECSPIFCSGTKAEKAKGPKAEKAVRSELAKLKLDADDELDKLLPRGDPLYDVARKEAVAEKVNAVARMGKAVARLAARRAFMNIPKGLKGAEAEEWVQAHAIELAPKALAVIEYQMEFGDDAQQRDSARDVLDMVGMRKKEAAGGGGATIILQLNGGAAQLPWSPQAQVVEGTVTKDDEKKQP